MAIMAFLLMVFEVLFKWIKWVLGWCLPVESPPCVDMPGKELSSSVRELYAPNGDPDMDVIFFHGLDFGESRDANTRAWMSGDGSECWPQKWLPERFPGARILAVSYDSSAVQTSTRGRMDVELIAEILVSDLIFDVDVGAGQGLYRPLVLVGHSVGGLVIHQLCLHAFDAMNSYRRDEPNRRRLDTFLRNLRGVFYYSTPHAGSRLADIAPRKGKRRGAIMEIMDFQRSRAANLPVRFKGLREKYKDVWTLAGVVETGETQLPGFCDVAVDTASARIGNNFGELFAISEDDHFSICRPRSRRAGSYKKLVIFLNQIQKEAKPDDMQSICSREKFLVGLPARVQEIESILKTVPTLGLFGMGGVGKSTLARAILEACHLNFSYSCWIPDFKELVERNSKPDLERRMKEGLRHRGRKLPAEDVDWHTLKGQTVLVVIDNVDEKCEDELDYYMRLTNGFGDQSRVIVTSRNKGFCERKFQRAFDVSGLTAEQSSELFLHHAFPLGGPSPPSHGMLLRVLRFCGGLPLAIEVLGRVLHKVTAEDMWETVIQKLEEGEPASGDNDDGLLNSLRLSYDGLRPEEQKMFLDAALCLIHEPISKALQICRGCWGRTVPICWRNLTFSCLVDIRNDTVWVHDSLRMLAQGIACPKHGPLHTWQLAVTVKDVDNLLTDASQEPCKAEGLICATSWRSDLTRLVSHGDKITQAWFPQLRILIMQSVDLRGDAIRLPSSLVYLKWSHSTCRTLPFLLGHLTRLWWLDLAECGSLEFLPEHLDGLTALNRLQLGRCRSLRFLPDAVGKLTSLECLELQGCRSLATLPDTIGNLTSLQKLELAECLSLVSLPDTVGNLVNLERLVLERCHSLATLPDTIGKLTSLQRLELAGCSSLVSLTDTVGNLKNLERLKLETCRSLAALLDSIGKLANLQRLEVAECQSLVSLLHTVGKLIKLEMLGLRECGWKLTSLPDAVANMTNLQILIVTGSGVSKLSDSLGSLKKLNVIEASGTALGRRPPTIVNWPALTRLDLSYTLVTYLPESMKAMKNMVSLNLSHTKLQMLPDSITELDALKFLTLSSTPLQILPERLGDLRQLTSLDLSETGLHELPISMTELQELQFVYLRGCKKLSCLPDGFENLRLTEPSLTCSDGQGIPGNLPPNSLEELPIQYHADAVLQSGLDYPKEVTLQDLEVSSSSSSESCPLRKDVRELGWRSFDEEFNPNRILCLYAIRPDSESVEMSFFHVEGMSTLVGIGVPFSTLIVDPKQKSTITIEEGLETTWRKLWMDDHTGSFFPLTFEKQEQISKTNSMSCTVGSSVAIDLSAMEAATKFGVGMEEGNRFIKQSTNGADGFNTRLLETDWLNLLCQLVDHRRQHLQITKESCISGVGTSDGVSANETSHSETSQTKSEAKVFSVKKDDASESADTASKNKLQSPLQDTSQGARSDVKVMRGPNDNEEQKVLVIHVIMSEELCKSLGKLYKLDGGEMSYRERMRYREDPALNRSRFQLRMIVEFLCPPAAAMENEPEDEPEDEFVKMVNVTLDVVYQFAGDVQDPIRFGWYQNKFHVSFECEESDAAILDVSPEVVSPLTSVNIESTINEGVSVTASSGSGYDLGIQGGFQRFVQVVGRLNRTKGCSHESSQSDQMVHSSQRSCLQNAPVFTINDISGTSKMEYRMDLLSHCRPDFAPQKMWVAKTRHDYQSTGMFCNVPVRVKGTWHLEGDRHRFHTFGAEKELRLYLKTPEKTQGCNEYKEAILKQKIEKKFLFNHSFSHIQLDGRKRVKPYRWVLKAGDRSDSPKPIDFLVR